VTKLWQKIAKQKKMKNFRTIGRVGNLAVKILQQFEHYSKQKNNLSLELPFTKKKFLTEHNDQNVF